MPKITYVPRTFRQDTLSVIATAEAICQEYARQGYDLTLRQLYYQFVARGLIPNRDSEYKRLGSIVNDARLAGLIDWDHLSDRTRSLRDLAHWTSPESIVDAVARQYRTARWDDQPRRVEVWIEKDALVGVIAGACERYDVAYFSCRGYTSQSEMWAAAQRHRSYNRRFGQHVTVLHLGDHDPSGKDMTRDIEDRLTMFGAPTLVHRIALTMDQVRQYDPPPNPAKLTDARAQGYIEEFHDPDIDEPGEARSWELDALPPDVLDTLVEEHILDLRDDEQWEESTEAMDSDRRVLAAVSERWPEIVTLMNGDGS